MVRVIEYNSRQAESGLEAQASFLKSICWLEFFSSWLSVSSGDYPLTSWTWWFFLVLYVACGFIFQFPHWKIFPGLCETSLFSLFDPATPMRTFQLTETPFLNPYWLYSPHILSVSFLLVWFYQGKCLELQWTLWENEDLSNLTPLKSLLSHHHLCSSFILIPPSIFP